MIIQGDCLEVLRTYPDNHFTSVITDPPYGLSFMGKKWDYDVPSVEIWKECLRVLKPGGTMLCFAGSRTQHRMAVNIEDAGFTIKDCLMWIYGSGFPKATDISKQLDKGIERKRIADNPNARDSHGKNLISMQSSPNSKDEGITEPATPEAKFWNGYKSHGLKPAYEPIILCMKPNEGSYAENALKHGVAGINIDKSRVGITGARTNSNGKRSMFGGNSFCESKTHNAETKEHNYGRFPANITLDEEAGKMLGDKARFFYCSKASPSERSGSTHPTMKPLELMKYLINLVMPPKDGLLLDPFAGSGTTIVAAKQLGFDATGIEREEEYCEIANARIKELNG